MSLRILLVQTFYPEFLRALYAADPDLGRRDYAGQHRRVFGTYFGVGDAYSHHLRALGWEATEVICNADVLQERWAAEHDLALVGNVHDRRRQIVAAQVAANRPDVLYVFEWSPLGDAFLAEMRSRVGLLVGQIASPLPGNRTFEAYHLMVSSWPPIVDHFRAQGQGGEYLRLGFDERVLNWLEARGPREGVTFVGGFAPSHPDRAAWLEHLLRTHEVDVYGYGVEQTAPGSAIRARHRGEVWGRRMYEVLAHSRITLNRHARIDVRGSVSAAFANNMRLYEATGVGTCLVTENRPHLGELFEAGVEVVAYDDEADCVEKVGYYLAHDNERAAIALAGQRRTLRDHTYARRMSDLDGILRRHLAHRECHSGRGDGGLWALADNPLGVAPPTCR